MAEGRDPAPDAASRQAASGKPSVLAIAVLVLTLLFLAASVGLLIWVR